MTDTETRAWFRAMLQPSWKGDRIRVPSARGLEVPSQRAYIRKPRGGTGVGSRVPGRGGSSGALPSAVAVDPPRSPSGMKNLWGIFIGNR